MSWKRISGIQIAHVMWHQCPSSVCFTGPPTLWHSTHLTLLGSWRFSHTRQNLQSRPTRNDQSHKHNPQISQAMEVWRTDSVDAGMRATAWAGLARGPDRRGWEAYSPLALRHPGDTVASLVHRHVTLVTEHDRVVLILGVVVAHRAHLREPRHGARFQRRASSVLCLTERLRHICHACQCHVFMLTYRIIVGCAGSNGRRVAEPVRHPSHTECASSASRSTSRAARLRRPGNRGPSAPFWGRAGHLPADQEGSVIHHQTHTRRSTIGTFT